MTSRSTDPSTSKEAGALATTATKLRASHKLIENAFVAYGDMTDKALLEVVHDIERNLGKRKLMSASGVRSRRSELSKPNMERIAEIMRERSGVAFSASDVHHWLGEEEGRNNLDPAIRQLRIEGFRSKLIDTGKREVIDGRQNIVWGLAK